MRLHRDSQLSEADTWDATEEDYETRGVDDDTHGTVHGTTGKPRRPVTVEHRSVGQATTPPQFPQRQCTEAGCAGSIPASSSIAGLEPAESLPFISDPWAEALIECFDYMRNRPSPGAVRLYDAVNEAWCYFTAKRFPF